MEKKRWLYAGVGTIILLFAGLVYAWSLIASPIAAYFPTWTKAQLSFTFTMCMSFFCLGGLVAGIIVKKVKTRYILWASGVLFFVGFFIASKAESLTMLYIGYGVLAGFASGLAYNGIMSCVTKWFTDKPGLISGVLLMGFGFGSFIIGKVYQAYTPEGPGIEAWRDSLFVFGIILVIVLIIGGIIVKAPGADFIPPKPSEKKHSKKPTEEGIEVGPVGMLKRPTFWLYFSWSVFLSAAGLALISQARGIVLEINPIAAAGSVATIVGFISIFNGIGRVISGALFDKIGRKATMFVVNGTFFAAVGLLILALTVKSVSLITVAFMVSGLAYGGITPMNSAFIGAFYGPKHYSVNYPIVNMNLLLASFGGTIAGGIYDGSGSYLNVFYLMLGAVAISTVTAALIRRP